MLYHRYIVLSATASMLGLLGCDPGRVGCKPDETLLDGVCVSEGNVRLNSVGFLPDRAKRASILGTATAFDVHRKDDNSIVFSGTATGPMTNEDTLETLTIADFTALTDTGTFYINVPSVGRSPDFQIAPDLYGSILTTVALGLTGARCGTEVSIKADDTTFSHAACHLKDGYLDYVEPQKAGTIRPSLHGWHDAGDYGKYTVNGAFAAGMVLKAWEHFGAKLAKFPLQVPEHGKSNLPDILSEVKFQLDWLATVQEVDGSVAHKMTATGFEGMVPPETDTNRRYYTPTGTAATADFVAIMAQAARVYEPFDPQFAADCRAKATLSYAYLTANTANQRPDLAGFTTGDYQTDDPDDRIWAAAEMWETTGDPVALADFETRAAAGKVDTTWDWGNVGDLGIFTYALSKQDGRTAALVETIQANVIASADSIVAGSQAHGYGRGFSQYWWGSNGVSARQTMNLFVAQQLSPKDDYLDTAVAQVDYLLGRNTFGRSFVTHLGFHPAGAPHHRPSVANGKTWPGLLVGGPQKQAASPAPNDPSGAMSWSDSADDYTTNEVAINWTAPLIYAVAGFLP